MGDYLRKYRLFIGITSGVFFLLLVLASALYVFVNHTLSKPSINQETVYYYLPKGSGLIRAAFIAERDGIVEHAWQFKYAALYLGVESKLRSGEFEIPKGLPLREILMKIVRGNSHSRKVTIPEGYSVLQAIDVLSNSFGIEASSKINALPIEGSLLPETYVYERGDTLNTLLQRMEKEMQKVLLQAWDSRAGNLPIQSMEEALILASIVEKETALQNERSLVAAVFLNRLRKGMRLQSDPTIIYGLTNGLPLGRAITKADINSDTPYNTYRIKGLPPTPIANPGLEAIKAVLNPPEGADYLYFVADGTGGHAFAKTLKEHNKNVANWRKIERERAQ
ncbi:endolytic transglycosylase MltG [Kordiimonas sp. SCSIO 12610]|uniref:endolytic transglycosylase MltG n=1 Tax=Kordiimonas sp. SCSIO 12610 TaxID=2829597 RepID=UPI00210A904E|nr:endolytic transglycosylase MltG [Kordiimonas sp. SCSIO 12610]UTW53869.1 endolytic transglycosylase MltG [Kordiimonas sp. SCSIO 12610]